MKDAFVNAKIKRRKPSPQKSDTRRIVKMVSFSGVDGAGKSTQIEALCRALDATGARYRVIRFWDEVAGLARFREAITLGIFKSDSGIGSPEAPVNRRDKNVRSWPMTWVRLCLYMMDALSLRALVRKMSRSNYELIVFDRFIYDELANLNLRNPAVRIYIRTVLSLVPKPDISYLLDADPIQARARKPEYPLEFIYLNRESYLALSRIVGGVTVIGPMPIEEVKREIMTHGAELFSGKDRQYVA